MAKRLNNKEQNITATNVIKKFINDNGVEIMNQMIKVQGSLGEFEVSKQTLVNISKWALNGNSDEEIRSNLELSPKQWQTLVSICPILLLIMGHSRALADIVVAGTLFETAVGGKKIKKQMPVKVKEYNECGRVIGEHYETYEYEEELPPNALLLKFLAENKLSEKFGKVKLDNDKQYKEIIDNMTEEERKLFENSNVISLGDNNDKEKS